MLGFRAAYARRGISLELGDRLPLGYQLHISSNREQAMRGNRRLNEQLLTLQEQERSELAPDHHDEVSPYLFAIGAEAATASRLLRESRASEAGENVQTIADAVRHMQRQVGRMLSRLRPIGLAEFGLREAIENLVAFWRRRRPEIRFEITISPQCKNFGDLLGTTICRVVQGALSNAVRHARPNHIAILIECDRDEVRVAITDDGPGMPEPSRLGYGLVGIKERVIAIGGRTTFSNKSGEGFAVITLLPLTMSAPVSTAKTLKS